MKGPTSYGFTQTLADAADEDKILVWSRSMNDWVSVPMAAVKALGGGSPVPLLINNVVVLINDIGILINAETYLP